MEREEKLMGLGMSSNIQLTPKLELIPETNIVINKISQSNATLGVRWNTTDNLSIDIYTSTAASIFDVGQLIGANSFKWGTRLVLSL